MIIPTYDLIVEHIHQPNFWLKLKYPEANGHLWVCAGFIIDDLNGIYLGEFRMTVRELQNLYKQAIAIDLYNLQTEAA